MYHMERDHIFIIKIYVLKFICISYVLYICYNFYAFLCFSRDKTNLNELITNEAIKIILQNAILTKICEEDQVSYTSGNNN